MMQANTKKLLGRVPMAWPTLLVSGATIAVWLGASALALAGVLPLWLAALLNGLAAFFAFTPMHDASHKSVSNQPWVNELVGHASGVLLAAPFAAFRMLHLTHHRHTNEPGLDPDFWSGEGSRWSLPLRWLTQDLHYYHHYFQRWATRPKAERRAVIAQLCLLYGAALALSFAGFGLQVVVLWLLPARIALAFLAWGFDYLPHRPHQVPARVDRFAATRILADRWLTPLFLYQNYHLIHHLYPAVPFYRYGQVWRAKRAELLHKGARVEHLIPRPAPQPQAATT